MKSTKNSRNRKKNDLSSTDWILKNYKFVLFIGFLGAVYINNSHQMEKKFSNMRKLEIEVANLKTEYKSRLSNYATYQKPSKIISIGKALGLSTSGSIPKKIIVKKQ